MNTAGPEPTISKTFADGTLVELIYRPEAKTTALAVARPDGSITAATDVTAPTGERLVPYSATNNLIATDCVLLPSDVTEFGSKAELLEAVRGFLHRYVDLSPLFEEIAAHYVLLSWVYEAFNELPYLRFRGEFGTGKTRALLAVGSLCYKPFFASGASTVSPIFHVLEAFRGTLALDEADFRFSDATASLTKILNNGNLQGLPVLRTMSNRHRELNPQAYRVFGPKLVAMRGRFADTALESRFITEETGGRPLRADVPIELPKSLREEARLLRNKLLAWRFRSLAIVGAEPGRIPEGLSPRTRQTGLALLSLMDDAGLRVRMAELLRAQEMGSCKVQGPTLEALMLEALLDGYEASTDGSVTVAALTELFNAKASSVLGKDMPNRWVGGFLRSRLEIATMKTKGVYVVPAEARPRVMMLAARHGLATAPSSSEQKLEESTRCEQNASWCADANVGDDGKVAPSLDAGDA